MVGVRASCGPLLGLALDGCFSLTYLEVSVLKNLLIAVCAVFVVGGFLKAFNVDVGWPALVLGTGVGFGINMAIDTRKRYFEDFEKRWAQKGDK